ncbi:hypothetical protein JTB14_036996 [Gonioctena quinquepunctata]|nr:hypothetical protein JTB14_036996 [Gonioctena quinquepunctata]
MDAVSSMMWKLMKAEYTNRIFFSASGVVSAVLIIFIYFKLISMLRPNSLQIYFDSLSMAIVVIINLFDLFVNLKIIICFHIRHGTPNDLFYSRFDNFIHLSTL